MENHKPGKVYYHQLLKIFIVYPRYIIQKINCTEEKIKVCGMHEKPNEKNSNIDCILYGNFFFKYKFLIL